MRRILITILTVAISRLPVTAHDSDLPLWHGQFTIADFLVFHFEMVGTDPKTPGFHKTTIPTFLMPVKLRFAGGITTDPSIPTPNESTGVPESPLNLVLASPLFQPADFFAGGHFLGKTQYIDAYQRANFFNHLDAGHDFHVLLQNPPSVLPVTIDVPLSAGFAIPFGAGTQGFVDLDFLKSKLRPWMTVAGTAALPIFLLADTKMTEPGGRHVGASHGFSGKQTYIIANFTPQHDILGLTHEVGEWLADPYKESATPPWLNPENDKCSRDMEIADPINGLNHAFTMETTLGRPVTFHLQDLAFLSWFAHRIPSTSAGGLFSFWGNLTGPPPICTQ